MLPLFLFKGHLIEKKQSHYKYTLFIKLSKSLWLNRKHSSSPIEIIHFHRLEIGMVWHEYKVLVLSEEVKVHNEKIIDFLLKNKNL